MKMRPWILDKQKRLVLWLGKCYCLYLFMKEGLLTLPGWDAVEGHLNSIHENAHKLGRMLIVAHLSSPEVDNEARFLIRTPFNVQLLK